MSCRSTILWVLAHPDPASLNGALFRHSVDRLEKTGHEVITSDLYAMGWSPVLSPEDITPAPHPFRPSHDIRQAYAEGRLAPDVAEEQDKLRAADAVVLQFPMWWYSVPAILKGWFDRVLTAGFAFGTDPETGRRLRFEQGPFRGTRALVITTLGDRPAAIGPRGISGEIHELLFGLLHGTLAYTGMDVLRPIPIPRADVLDEGELPDVLATLEHRLSRLFTDDPLPYRRQFSGDYSDQWDLKPHIRPGESGMSIHLEA